MSATSVPEAVWLRVFAYSPPTWLIATVPHTCRAWRKAFLSPAFGRWDDEPENKTKDKGKDGSSATALASTGGRNAWLTKHGRLLPRREQDGCSDWLFRWSSSPFPMVSTMRLSAHPLTHARGRKSWDQLRLAPQSASELPLASVVCSGKLVVIPAWHSRPADDALIIPKQICPVAGRIKSISSIDVDGVQLFATASGQRVDIHHCECTALHGPANERLVWQGEPGNTLRCELSGAQLLEDSEGEAADGDGDGDKHLWLLSLLLERSRRYVQLELRSLRISRRPPRRAAALAAAEEVERPKKRRRRRGRAAKTRAVKKMTTASTDDAAATNNQVAACVPAGVVVNLTAPAPHLLCSAVSIRGWLLVGANTGFAFATPMPSPRPPAGAGAAAAAHYSLPLLGGARSVLRGALAFSMCTREGPERSDATTWLIIRCSDPVSHDGHIALFVRQDWWMPGGSHGGHAGGGAELSSVTFVPITDDKGEDGSSSAERTATGLDVACVRLASVSGASSVRSPRVLDATVVSGEGLGVLLCSTGSTQIFDLASRRALCTVPLLRPTPRMRVTSPDAFRHLPRLPLQRAFLRYCSLRRSLVITCCVTSGAHAAEAQIWEHLLGQIDPAALVGRNEWFMGFGPARRAQTG